MAFSVSWVRIFFGDSLPILELLAPPPELTEDRFPALSPVSGKPPAVVGSFVVSTGFLPAKKAKNPAASIMMIMAVMIIFVVLFINYLSELVVVLSLKNWLLLKSTRLGLMV